MNVNMLRDADNDAGFYAAACATDILETWRGARLYCSSDGGVTYAPLNTITDEAVIGYATTILGDFHSGNIPDEINSITVTMLNGTLSSTTNEGLRSGVNTCVIGEEILFFRDATLVSLNTYKLTGLLRGRRGSEYAMAGHVAHERFVLANLSLVRVAQSLADVGMERLYKAVSVGATVSGTPSQTFKNIGCGLKPYAPVHLGGGRDASGNATLKWVRRSRIGAEWRDGVDVAVWEAAEDYVVEIYSDNTYTTVKRTISGLSSPTATYSAADQTTDFGSPQSTIYFRVYQTSTLVGRGHAADGQL